MCVLSLLIGSLQIWAHRVPTPTTHHVPSLAANRAESRNGGSNHSVIGPEMWASAPAPPITSGPSAHLPALLTQLHCSRCHVTAGHRAATFPWISPIAEPSTLAPLSICNPAAISSCHFSVQKSPDGSSGQGPPPLWKTPQSSPRRLWARPPLGPSPRPPRPLFFPFPFLPVSARTSLAERLSLLPHHTTDPPGPATQHVPPPCPA